MGSNEDNHFEFIERRAENRSLNELMRQVLLGMEHLEKALKAEIRQAATDAFPDGDPIEHKKYHLSLIRQADSKTAFWDKMRFELTRWGLIGFLGWVVYQLWVAFLHGPK